MHALVRMLVAGAAIPTLVAAQRPVRPVLAEEVKAHAVVSAHLDLERMRIDAEHLRLETEQIRMAAMESARLDATSAKADAATMASASRVLEDRPRSPWLQGDPADSVYRLARESLNRGEYRRAAQLFNEVTRRFASSGYAQHSAYWEAFARYRLGTTEELKVALQILEGKGEFRFDPGSLSRESGADVPSLRARILGTLASRGDRPAQEALRQQAAQAGGCDREDVSVRAEALAALGQMDMTAALPSIRKVLANRDECTVELRRRALYLLGRDAVEGRLQIMTDVARNDPDIGLRGEAWSLIGRTGGDAAIPLLEEALRTVDDERTQRYVIGALGAVDSDRARVAVRAIIERADAPERVRAEAIMSLGRTRNERMPSAEELSYLRALYAKVESHRMREAVLTALGRVPTAENQAFLTSVVRNQNETASLRSAALQRLVQHDSYKVADIGRLYEVADARSLREQVLYALSRRNETEAVDKMIDIARKDTDPQIRRTAISLLARSKNPKAQQFLQELLDR